jgi:hypothetical protein
MIKILYCITTTTTTTTTIKTNCNPSNNNKIIFLIFLYPLFFAYNGHVQCYQLVMK